MNNPLQAVSNVIELKKGKQYIFLFTMSRDTTHGEAMRIASSIKSRLEKLKVDASVHMMWEGSKLEVIEKDEE